ncbi:hypothetical protein [Propionibacterium sp.]|uniref:arsenate reductase/protein-tyrosine-phosphatase family protein n=1 Tax=Propionibacterium sp. TaxID=1977903 RepID=UPI0039E8B6C9
MTLRVLTVCTGNICRSPAAAAMLNAALPGVVEATSAGTRSVRDSDMEPHIRQLLVSRGITPDPHRAHTVTERELDGIDLVLTMTTDQRGAVAELNPMAVRRSFTLKEFARIAVDLVDSGRVQWQAHDEPEERLRQMVEPASRYRGRSFTGDDDVKDPYGGTQTDYEQAIVQIEQAVETIRRTFLE